MIDASQLEAFARKVEAASADLKPYMGKTLQEVGEEFLTIAQEAIEGAGNVDTGKLLSSFTKGGSGNVWNLDLGGLALEIGSTLDYAKYVNDGHRQQPGRFVPGYWEGNHFRYSPGAKSGMVLKASFVAGSHFFDRSVQTLERMFPEMADKAFEQFFRRYFGEMRRTYNDSNFMFILSLIQWMQGFQKVQRSGCCRDNLLLHDVYCMGDGYLQF